MRFWGDEKLNEIFSRVELGHQGGFGHIWREVERV